VQTKNPKGMSRMSKAAAAAEEQHRKQKNPKKRAKKPGKRARGPEPSAHKKPTVRTELTQTQHRTEMQFNDLHF